MKGLFCAGPYRVDEDEAAHGLAGEVHRDAALAAEGGLIDAGVDAGHEAIFFDADAHFAVHQEKKERGVRAISIAGVLEGVISRSYWATG